VRGDAGKWQTPEGIQRFNHGTNKQGRIESLQPLTYGTEERPAVIRFRNDWESAYPRLINQLLRFPLTSEHDDVPDALEGAVQLARSSAQAGARPFLVGGGGY